MKMPYKPGIISIVVLIILSFTGCPVDNTFNGNPLTEAKWLAILEKIDEDPEFSGILDLSGYSRSASIIGGGLRADGLFDPMPGINQSAKAKITAFVLPDETDSFEGRQVMYFLGPYSDDDSRPIIPFADFTSLEEVTGRNVTTIGDMAFYDCSSLINADFPKVNYIGFGAFFNCSLTGIDFPELTELYYAAFLDCKNLTSAYLPKAARIGITAFANCTSLASAYLPEVTYLNDLAFGGVFVHLITGEEFKDRVLEITMGSEAPSLGVGVLGPVSDTVNATVRVIVPAGAEGYGTSPADTETKNWGNALRGMGCSIDNGLFEFYRPDRVDAIVNLIIEYQP